MRLKYPQSMVDNELLSSLTEVNFVKFPNIQCLAYILTNINFIYNNKSTHQKGNPEYNAYEKDIAVVNLYFGDSTVFGDLFGIIFLS